MVANLRRLPATVWALGLVSLLTDAASDMVYPLLPALLGFAKARVEITRYRGLAAAIGVAAILPATAAAATLRVVTPTRTVFGSTATQVCANPSACCSTPSACTDNCQAKLQITKLQLTTQSPNVVNFTLRAIVQTSSSGGRTSRNTARPRRPSSPSSGR